MSPNRHRRGLPRGCDGHQAGEAGTQRNHHGATRPPPPGEHTPNQSFLSWRRGGIRKTDTSAHVAQRKRLGKVCQAQPSKQHLIQK